ncbi:MAG TPA: hypothetical protein VIJ12_02550 [Candidatus Baltobacteraceae bacterium]
MRDAPVGNPVTPSTIGTDTEVALCCADHARASRSEAMICATSRSRPATVRGQMRIGPHSIRCAHEFARRPEMPTKSMRGMRAKSAVLDVIGGGGGAGVVAGLGVAAE